MPLVFVFKKLGPYAWEIILFSGVVKVLKWVDIRLKVYTTCEVCLHLKFELWLLFLIIKNSFTF